MQAVAGHDAECGVRRILKVGTFGGDDDVAQQGIFGMRGGRAIDGRDHRHLYIENVFEDLCALAQDLVVSRGSEEIETCGRELGAKFSARAGQDDDVVVAIIADVAERPNQRFVHVAVEHQRTASRVQGDLQYSVFALHPDVFVFVAVTVEHAHAPRGYLSVPFRTRWCPYYARPGSTNRCVARAVCQGPAGVDFYRGVWRPLLPLH